MVDTDGVDLVHCTLRLCKTRSAFCENVDEHPRHLNMKIPGKKWTRVRCTRTQIVGRSGPNNTKHGQEQQRGIMHKRRPRMLSRPKKVKTPGQRRQQRRQQPKLLQRKVWRPILNLKRAKMKRTSKEALTPWRHNLLRYGS